MVTAWSLISGALLWQCIGAWQDSQTTDEAVHLAAGYSYWRTGNFRLNPEHPPLIKLLAAAPLLVVKNLPLPVEVHQSTEINEWEVGRQLLYNHGRPLHFAQTLLFIARLPMILIWLSLGLLIWWWSWRRYGDIAGLSSLAFFLFDPNFLGHGHLVTTDVGLSLFFLATIIAADIFFRRPNWRRLGLLVILFGLAQVTKFSALLLWFLLPLLGLIRLRMPPTALTWSWWRRLVGGLVIGTAIVVSLTYGFEWRRPNSDPRIARLLIERQELAAGDLASQPPLIQKLVKLGDPAGRFGPAINSVLNAPVPAYNYWRGIFALTSHNFWGHAAYLNGEFSYRGWWWYFPEAIGLKTPLITLGLLVASAWLGWRRWRRQRQWSFDFWLFTIPPAVYLLWSLTSHINIGLRHIFPTYPFWFVLIGSLVQPVSRWTRQMGERLLLGGAAVLLLTTGLAWPNTIGYFNALAGGTSGGHRYLLDSNLDWNQDAWRLQKYLATNTLTPVYVGLFGTLPADRFFPTAKPVPTNEDTRLTGRLRGIVAISAGNLYDVNGPYGWLRQERPSNRVGSSILIYQFR